MNKDYEQAPCIATPVEMFYDSTIYFQVIKAFCSNCPIREKCLQDCLKAESIPVDGKYYRSGVFGGLTPTGRNNLVGTTYDVISDDGMERNNDLDRN